MSGIPGQWSSAADLGLEAADGLARRGMAVTVLHRSPWLLNRQLDETGGQLLREALEQRGLSIRTGTSPVAILGRHQVRAVQLDDETLISTDLVVVAAGIRPNIELARDAGLDCDRAILVDAQLRTSDPDIYALGECCQVGSETFGLVEPGYQQAKVLADRLGCGSSTAFVPGVIPTRLKISGIPIFSCGQTQTDGDTESVIWHDFETNRYCRLLVRDRRLAGAVLFGDTADGPWYSERIRTPTTSAPAGPGLRQAILRSRLSTRAATKARTHHEQETTDRHWQWHGRPLLPGAVHGHRSRGRHRHNGFGERQLAYDRVHLSEHAQRLQPCGSGHGHRRWYSENHIDLHSTRR